MQSMPGALSAHKHDRHFASPSMGWANFPPENAVGLRAGGTIKRLPASGTDAEWTWRTVPSGTVRLTVFISVSAQHLRTPMNSPLRSARLEKRQREAGFDEGCVV
ncbi:hypothetical protein [Paraburkholderia megapolitana]|uniref:hypothetical protein n=1 Tax=Paraburkholderia megapolitana TaxID=420953 RepID=UPI0038BAF974